MAHAVKAQRLAKVCKLPLNRSGRFRAPWSPSSCTRLPHPSRSLIAKVSLWSHRFGAPFASFHWFPSRRFNLTVRHIDVILTTLLSIALRRCRPTASSVSMLPLCQWRHSASWSPSPEPGSSIAHIPKSMGMPFHLSAADFPRSVFRFLSAGFHLADLRANPGPEAHNSLLPALRTEVIRTPASLARQSLLSAHHPAQDSQPSQRSRVV